MLRMLEAQAPAKQNATDTISTLSSRLGSATLLEDRRAAILGLRSFAKEYPASVASGALRGLIGSLTKDAEDVDTIKVVLETLLMLFNPDERSPEASEEIALWLADEFTQRQDNITILLDFLESQDFYSRLYSLQLLSAISAARPERTQECILTAPLGTTRLVAALEDPRDAIQNAALVLLTDLSNASPELQKLIAFENAFDRLFAMIAVDGGLQTGGIVVQDCLSLLANLVRYNGPNQSLFRETGCVAKLAELLPGGKRVPVSEQEEEWANPQRDKNIWGVLAVLRMFLISGSTATIQNQNAFVKHGMLQLVLNLAFDHSTAIPIKAEALNTCADMIRGNSRVQEAFAQLQVTPVHPSEPTANGVNGAEKSYVIDALLDLALTIPSVAIFNVRIAAVECIKAYLFNHSQIRLHFLRRAIELHTSGEDESPNIVTTLLYGPQVQKTVDPYRIWFAGVLVFHLLYEDSEAKTFLMGLVEGNAEEGEEVVTCIQTFASNLITALQSGEDERIIVAYLMVLTGWLSEDPAAVNDFLGEGSSLKVLMQIATRPTSSSPLSRGLCAALLGFIYEFSTKDSPIPRRKLQPLLLSGIGRERYIEALTLLRQTPLVRDFEVLPQDGEVPGALPEVYFDSKYIEFLKDSFSRLTRAIDRDPGIEVNQTVAGIDRDLVDELRGQLEEKSQALLQAEAIKEEVLRLETNLSKKEAEQKRLQETAAAESTRLAKINDALQQNITKLEQSLAGAQAQLTNLQTQLAESRGTIARQVEDKTRLLQEAETLKRKIAAAESTATQQRTDHAKAQENFVAQVKSAADARKRIHDELESTKSQVKVAMEKLIEAERRQKDKDETLRKGEAALKNEQTRASAVAKQVTELKEALEKSEKALAEKEEAKNSVQSELDDLFMLLSELEEKRKKDKERLKALGETVSDAENDEDEDEDDEDEDEDEEVD